MKSLFISYSSHDIDLTEHILSFLESNGQQCWIAPRDIPPASDWAELIIDAIDSSSGMVLILSKHSNESPQVRREVERAVSMGKTIYPLLVESIQLSKWMQFYISAHQWHEAIDIPLNRKLSDLLNAIESQQKKKKIEPDFSNLPELLEDDLTNLSTVLYVEEKEAERLLSAEKRKVTVLHISAHLDKEQISPVVQKTISKTVFNLIERFVKSFGGYLDFNEIDNCRCIFGLKQVQEDDSKKALSCGICLFNGFGELNSVLQEKNLSITFGLGVTSGILKVSNTEQINLDFTSNAAILSQVQKLAEVASNELLATRQIFDLNQNQYSWEKFSDGIYRITDYTMALPKSRTFSINSPFVGRKNELTQLNSLLNQQEMYTQEIHSANVKHLVIGIKGNAGIGKSRLLHEFNEKSCKQNDILVLKGQTLSFAQPTYWLWTTLLRNLLGIELGSNLNYIEFLTRLKTHCNYKVVKDSAPFLAELLSIKTEDKRLLELNEKAIALENKIAFSSLLQAISEKRKLVVILEDLHWINESDLDLLEFVVCNCSTEFPIIFFLVYRPEREDGTIVEFDINKIHAIVDEIEITEVDKEASKDLIIQLLESISNKNINQVSPEVITFLTERAHGNTFYLEELIFHLIDSAALIETEEQWELDASINNLSIPDSLIELLQSRLDMLPDSWRSVLQNSSVLGMEFQLKLYRKLANKLYLGRPRADIFDGLERKQIFLCERSAFEKKYIFRHILVHKTAYSTILDENLNKLHKAAAETFEEVFVKELQQVSGVLMHHYEKAGEKDKAINWGMKALTQYNHKEALDLCDKLESLLKEQKDSELKQENIFKVMYKRVKVFDLQGNRIAQKQVIEQIQKNAEKSGSKYNLAVALKALGTLAWSTGRKDEVEDYFTEALKLAREVGDRNFEGIILGNIGSLHINQGRINKAREFFEEALAIHREAVDLRSESIILMNLGVIYKNLDSMDKAQSKYEEALEIAYKVGDRLSIGNILINLGSLSWTQGFLEKARAYYDKALIKNREIGNRRSEGVTLTNLGILHMDLGNISESLANYQEALEINRSIGDLQNEGTTLGNIGVLLADLNRLEEAKEHYEKALAINKEVGNRRFEGIVLGYLGNIYFKMKEYHKARTFYINALNINREVENYRDEAVVLASLATLCVQEKKYSESQLTYIKVLKIISDIKLTKGSIKGFAELRESLLSTGYSKEEVPWPSAWEPDN